MQTAVQVSYVLVYLILTIPWMKLVFIIFVIQINKSQARG